MPNAVGRFGRLSWLWLSLLVLVIDQASKFYFENRLEMFQQIVIIPDYFSWTLAYNTGAAFSFLADSSGWQRWLFALIAIVVSAVLVVWLKRLGRNDTWLAIALALVIWITYRSADRISRLMGPTGGRTVTRLSAFLLLCIGVQILITGVEDVLGPLLARH